MNNCKKNLPKKENYDQCRYMYCIGPTGPRGPSGLPGMTGPTARCNKSSIYIFKW